MIRLGNNIWVHPDHMISVMRVVVDGKSSYTVQYLDGRVAIEEEYVFDFEINHLGVVDTRQDAEPETDSKEE